MSNKVLFCLQVFCPYFDEDAQHFTLFVVDTTKGVINYLDNLVPDMDMVTKLSNVLVTFYIKSFSFFSVCNIEKEFWFIDLSFLYN